MLYDILKPMFWKDETSHFPNYEVVWKREMTVDAPDPVTALEFAKNAGVISPVAAPHSFNINGFRYGKDSSRRPLRGDRRAEYRGVRHSPAPGGDFRH